MSRRFSGLETTQVAGLTAMRVLMVHSAYRERGGEDISTEQEAAMLREHGHEVRLLIRRSDQADKLTLAMEGLGTRESKVYEFMRREIDSVRPDIVHCQNTWPRLGPTALDAIRDSGVPCVAAVRNYRSSGCPAGTMWRDGAHCEDCIGRAAIPAVIHGCWNGRAASAIAAIGTRRMDWSGIHLIAVSEFVRQKVIAAGTAPPEMVHVKPNCVAGGEPGPGDGNFALFLGSSESRPEKGFQLFQEAFQRANVGGLGHLCVTGRPHDEVLRLMGEATFVVAPALWDEPFGRVVIEAFSRGTPVLATRVGGQQELIDDGWRGTGWLCDPNAESLADALERAATDARHTRYGPRMRGWAFAEWQSKYTPEVNYKQLMRIYEKAMGARGVERGASLEGIA